MKAMILAAGRGERMRPLTDTCPKPLLQVGQHRLIEHHLLQLARAGIRDIVINHAWLGEQIESTIGDGSKFDVTVIYSPEAEALETAGGIANALDLLDTERFLVVNGDIFCDYDFALLNRVDSPFDSSFDNLAHLVMVDNPEHHPEGDFLLRDDLLTDQPIANSRDSQAPTQQKLTFSGIGVYHRDLFASIERGTAAPLAPLLRSAMQLGEVSGEYHQGYWSDIGTPARLQQARLDLGANV